MEVVAKTFKQHISEINNMFSMLMKQKKALKATPASSSKIWEVTDSESEESSEESTSSESEKEKPKKKKPKKE